MKDKFKFVFFGSSSFSLFFIEEAFRLGLKPALAVLPEEKPAGRGLDVKKTPLRGVLEKNGILVISWEKNGSKAKISALKGIGADFFLIVSFGEILPAEMLKIPLFGALNIHPSLLPKYRGPSPIKAQIISDEKDVGVSLMLMDEKIDHGPVIAAQKAGIIDWPVSNSRLEEILAREGARMTVSAVPKYLSGEIKPVPQNDRQASFTRKYGKEDGLIVLSDEPKVNYLKFLALADSPGVYFWADKKGRKIRVKIKEASFGPGGFLPLKVVPEGKREMDYQSFQRGL